MISCGMYSICGVVIWDVILGVVIWDVVMWDVQYLWGCHLGYYLGVVIWVVVMWVFVKWYVLYSICRVVIWDVILEVVIKDVN